MFYNFFGSAMWFGWIFWVAIIILIVWAVSNSSGRRRYHHNNNFPPQETPLDILKRRYAKGEITKEQFEQMKRDIAP